MSRLTFNGYKIMWVFVFFDLPTNTAGERKRAAKFRKTLLKDGFAMMQFSVYIRHCASEESAAVHIGRVKSEVPGEGHVAILKVTDKQYGAIINVWGKKSKPPPPTYQQLELF